jgi:hypothetical protein
MVTELEPTARAGKAFKQELDFNAPRTTHSGKSASGVAPNPALAAHSLSENYEIFVYSAFAGATTRRTVVGFLG